jgi:hypothetical protein
VEKGGLGVFWWLAQAGSFVVPVPVACPKPIFLEVKSFWTTTSHPWTKAKNKWDMGQALMQVLDFKLTAFLRPSTTESGVMVRPRPCLLLQNHSWRHLRAR